MIPSMMSVLAYNSTLRVSEAAELGLALGLLLIGLRVGSSAG